MGIKQMIATIQIYIMHQKDVEVQISPILPNDMPKLLIAYGIANRWVKENVTIIN